MSPRVGSACQPLCADRGRRRRLQPADAGAFQRTAAVAGVEPDGRKLAYVSFEYNHNSLDLHPGHRHRSARTRRQLPRHQWRAEFLPDGRRLALTLSKSGNPEIYVMDLGSKALRQLTDQFGIDTEAAWSPDGGSLYFTSDRGGKPQIYRSPPVAAVRPASASREATTPRRPCPTTARRSRSRRATATTTASRCSTAALARRAGAPLSPARWTNRRASPPTPA